MPNSFATQRSPFVETVLNQPLAGVVNIDQTTTLMEQYIAAQNSKEFKLLEGNQALTAIRMIILRFTNQEIVGQKDLNEIRESYYLRDLFAFYDQNPDQYSKMSVAQMLASLYHQFENSLLPKQ
jgi:hypothetical protein